MRVDKLLWFLRLSKTRGAAQTLIDDGHCRINGKRIERAAQLTAVGDVLVLPLPRGVTVIELLALPARRGPAPEAQSCYRVLDVRGDNPIAADNSNSSQGTNSP